MSKTYVIPFDGSVYSQQALLHAVSMGSANDRYVLLNVQEEENNRFTEHISEEELNKHYIENGNKILAKAEEILVEKPAHLIKEIKVGYPSLEITNVAKEYEAAGIIMGSRGLSPVVGNALGSVTYSVMHLAPCPVTIVPIQE